MPDPTSRILVPLIARALKDLDQLTDILAAINEARGDPDIIQVLVIEALTTIEAGRLALSMEPPGSTAGLRR